MCRTSHHIKRLACKLVLAGLASLSISSESQETVSLGENANWVMEFWPVETCVAVRTTEKVRHFFQLSGEKASWNWYTYFLTDQGTKETREYEFGFDFGNGTKHFITAELKTENVLGAEDLPLELIETIQAASHLTFSVDGEVLSDFELASSGTLIDTLRKRSACSGRIRSASFS